MSSWPDADSLERTLRHVVEHAGALSESPEAVRSRWVGTLGAALGTLPQEADEEHPVPFADVLRPFVLVFRRRLESSTGRRVLTERALAALEEGLLRELCTQAGRTLQLAFQCHRNRRQSSLDRLLAAAGGEAPRALYREFAASMVHGGWLPLLEEHPVLGRLMATLTDLWGDAHEELVDRLVVDQASIEATFAAGAAVGRVAFVRPALSDRHRGGRSVTALTFESGLQLVYKPRGLQAEAAFHRLLAGLNEIGAPVDQKPLQVRDCGTHGWVEHVAPRPCRSEADVADYYRRAGALTCLVYVLRGTDCHQHNLVACGAHPVLVDAETLMAPRLPTRADEATGDADAAVRELLESSVLGTGLIPRWEAGGGRPGAFDLSGLGSTEGDAVPRARLNWKDVNTDRMTTAWETVPGRPGANVPRLEGSDRGAQDHVGALLEGFRETYDFLARHPSELLERNGFLAPFRGAHIRVILRSTDVYGRLLEGLRRPDRLRDPVSAGSGIQRLSCSLQTPHDDRLLASERHALGRLDVPVFTADVDGRALVLEDGEEVPAFFDTPGHRLVVRRVQTLDEADRELQCRLIEESFLLRFARLDHRGSSAVPTAGVKPSGQGRPVEPRELLDLAAAIGDELKARAIRGTDGSVSWLGPQVLGETRRARLEPLGVNLYDGLTGVSVFLAALDKLSIGSGFRELALAASTIPRRTLRDSGWRSGRGAGALGAATGFGSLLYGLTRTGTLLGEDAVLDEVREAARSLNAGWLEEAEVPDVMDGVAGALLGLLTVHSLRPDHEILAHALAAGEHLLRARVEAGVGSCAWRAQGGSLRAGFSHGAAGIAYALLRLHRLTNDERFRVAAQEAIAYEESLFDGGAGNWPSVPPPAAAPPAEGEEDRLMIAWCNGASGIGLARLGGLSSLDTPLVRRDLAAALETTERALGDPRPPADHVCCGTMGRIELLVCAAQRLSQPDRLTTARRACRRLLGEVGGGLRTGLSLPYGVSSPGFFQGIAGVGYQALRLVDPQRLPSVLLWQ